MTSPYFNNYNSKNEQSLIENLMTEAIYVQGFEGFYILLDDVSPDIVFGDNPTKYFNKSYKVDLYLSNSVDPGLNNEFFSKFGLETKDNPKVSISRRHFNNVISQEIRFRPNEGDLIFIPWASGTGELYEIKYVNDSTDGFTLGRQQPYYYELELETFKYSHEKLDTGIEEIDIIEKDEAYSIDMYLANTAINMGNNNGNYTILEIVYQGNSYNTANCSAIASQWDYTNKVLTINEIKGEFSNTMPIKGNTSNTIYNIISFNDLEYVAFRSGHDNNILKTEEINLINTDEVNPFGGLGE